MSGGIPRFGTGRGPDGSHGAASAKPGDTSFEAWQTADRPGGSYEEWRRDQVAKAGGGQTGPLTGADSQATIKNPMAALTPEERIRQKRSDMGPAAIDPKTGRPLSQAPDLADLALRDATTGKVRKVRGGSTRDSILGTAMQYGVLLGVVGWAWLRALLRGEL